MHEIPEKARRNIMLNLFRNRNFIMNQPPVVFCLRLRLPVPGPERGIPGIFPLRLDHHQHHFEGGDGGKRMRDVGRHDDAFAAFQVVRFASDGDFHFAVEHVDQRIERGGVFAQPFALVEGEERDGAAAVFNDGAAHDRPFRIIDQSRRGEHLAFALPGRA